MNKSIDLVCYKPCRDCSGLSDSGPCYNVASGGDSHVYHHLLRMRGVAARKHLSPTDGKLGVSQTAQTFI